MGLKLLILLGLAAFAAAAPRTRNTLNEYLFRRLNNAGCSPDELKVFTDAGVNVEESQLDCNVARNVEKRGCSFVYTDSSACCSPACNWLMEFHCMSPSQMICKK